MRFVLVRYSEQSLPKELASLDSVIVPRMPMPLEVLWNELNLPRLLGRKAVDLYHGLKQCAPLRLRCPQVHIVGAIKRGGDDDLPIPLGPRLYWAWYACAVYRRSKHLMPVSGYVGDFLTDKLGIDPGKVTVVHNGISDMFLNARQRSHGGAADQLEPGTPYIVCVGSVIPLKNQLAVVRALAKIADRVPHHLVLLGREDPAYAKRVQDAADELRITARLHRAGFIHSDGLVKHMLGAEAMVHVSRTEGCCLATGEAMACGLPLVLTDRGGLREQCQDAAVYIDNPDDHDALAEAMLQVLSDPAKRQAMRQQGLDRSVAMTWDHAARANLEIYQRVLAG